MGEYTVPDHLYKPNDGEQNWTDAVNANWDIIQAKFSAFVGGSGESWTFGAGPPSNSVGVDGDLYFQTDTNQIWQKAGGVYAVEATVTGLPSGGNSGQVLRKLSSADFDVEWHSQAHADLTGVGADDHHAKSHIHDGIDGSGTVAHSATTGQTTDDHHAKVHAHDGVDGSGTVAHAKTTGIGADDHHAKAHVHNGADGSGTVAHSATTGRTANDHHNQVHALRSSDHSDVSTTGVANDGDALVYNAATGKWGPHAIGTSVGYVHTPDKGIYHQFVDPFRGQSGNAGTSWGDAMPTLTEASANLSPGVGMIEICAGRYDINESSLDYKFNHKAQLIIKGTGMRTGTAGGTEINWTGGDGTRSTGTCSATVGATTINAASGSFPSNAVSGNTIGASGAPDGSNGNKLIRIVGAGYGGADLLTWVATRTSGSQITIFDPIITTVTATSFSYTTPGSWIVYDPKFLWFMGSRTSASTAWGSQGGLQDLMFNVDANLAWANNQHRDNLCFIGIQNGQNGGWMRRVRVGDKNDDGTGSGVENFRDCLMGIYAFAGTDGSGGLGMNYFRDLWLFGGEYPFFSALSTNPVVLSGGSSTGKYGRAQIYIASGNSTTANLYIENWKTEMRDRYTSIGGYNYATDFGNPEDANGVPFLIDLADSKLALVANFLSTQQEAAGGHGGSSFVPSIPNIRYQPTNDPPAITMGRQYASKFVNAFSAPNISPNTKYNVAFPNANTRTVSYSFEKTLTAPYAASGTPTSTILGAMEVRDDGIYVRTSTGWKKATIA